MGLSPSRSVCDGLHQHRPCVWSSVPCWSTGDAGYPHLLFRAWKQNRLAIAWMNRAASQWMRGSGVPPVVGASGTRHPWKTRSRDYSNTEPLTGFRCQRVSLLQGSHMTQ